MIGSGKTKAGHDQSLDRWKEVFNKNFFSVVDLINLILPILDSKTKLCSITVTSAIAGLERVGAPITYSCAKAALSSFIPHLAEELSNLNVRVNGVNPGNIFLRVAVEEKSMNRE